jgi:phosphatidylserine/phosphatidylglycerophosphate/cardiolipin synthase-like enzyme
MTQMQLFEQAVALAASELGPVRLRELARGIERREPRSTIPGMVPVPGFAEAARAVLAGQVQDRVSDAEAVAYLRGVAAGFAQRADAVRVESVWSGPSSHAVPVRSTAQVLVEVIGESTSELLLTTYSAKPYQPVLDALASAIARGVNVSVVVETLQGAGSALNGAEPAAAFLTVPGVRLWHWPAAKRIDQGAKMHAKLAVADRRLLLISSANLTQSGVGKNIEAGLLVRGGAAPRRAAEHIAELQATGILARLHPSSGS